MFSYSTLRYGQIFEQDLDWFQSFVGTNYTINPQNNLPNKFHMNFYPEQIVGDPNSAKIFLLNMNPSFAPSDQTKQLPVQQEICDIIVSGKYDPNYPFYCLNPKYDSTNGNQWWRNGHHFKSWEKHYNGDRSRLAKAFCCVELLPYHCAQLPAPVVKSIRKCPSTRQVLNFIQNEIIPKAQAGEAAIIVLRCAYNWGFPADDPSHNIFFTSNTRAATFSINSMANKYPNFLSAITPLI